VKREIVKRGFKNGDYPVEGKKSVGDKQSIDQNDDK